MNDSPVVHCFFQMKADQIFSDVEISLANRAFLFGDAVCAYFFVRGGQLVMAEECYFYLMASMRKMRMAIPLDYTLEFFREMFTKDLIGAGAENGTIRLIVFRKESPLPLQKAPVAYFYDFTETPDVLALRGENSADIIKEIYVGSGLLNNLRVHCPENIYAEIYARENELDDLLMLNRDKRVARGIYGNFLFLEAGILKTPKTSEGAYISPLMENFITFVHYKKLAEISEAEILPFESQKCDEILMISDEKGIFAVSKIRNKIFGTQQFSEMLRLWQESFPPAISAGSTLPEERL